MNINYANFWDKNDSFNKKKLRVQIVIMGIS